MCRVGRSAAGPGGVGVEAGLAAEAGRGEACGPTPCAPAAAAPERQVCGFLKERCCLLGTEQGRVLP